MPKPKKFDTSQGPNNRFNLSSADEKAIAAGNNVSAVKLRSSLKKQRQQKKRLLDQIK